MLSLLVISAPKKSANSTIPTTSNASMVYPPPRFVAAV
jgi:hypothetical protein